VLVPALADAAGVAGEVVLVGETSLADLKTRPDYSVTIGTERPRRWSVHRGEGAG
jgi:hypothetical protein